MSDIKITFDLALFDASEFTWGDMEDLQAGKFTIMRELIERYAVVEGIPDNAPPNWLTNYLRGLKFTEMLTLTNELVKIVTERANPEHNGKNLNGGSPNTSQRKRVSRR